MSSNRFEKMAMSMEGRTSQLLADLCGKPYPYSLQDKINLLRYITMRCNVTLEKSVIKKYRRQLEDL